MTEQAQDIADSADGEAVDGNEGEQAPSLEDVIARLEASEKRNATLEKATKRANNQAAASRVRLAELEAGSVDAAASAGDVDAVKAHFAKREEELAADAALGAAYRARETDRLTEARDRMPDGFAAAYDSIPGFEARVAFVDAWQAEQAPPAEASPVKKPASSSRGGPTPTGSLKLSDLPPEEKKRVTQGWRAQVPTARSWGG